MEPSFSGLKPQTELVRCRNWSNCLVFPILVQFHTWHMFVHNMRLKISALLWPKTYPTCYLKFALLVIVIPILWITKEIMSRGPQVVDMECKEDYMASSTLLHSWETLSPPQMVTYFQMASTTSTSFRKAVGLTPWGTSQYYGKHHFNI